MNYGYTRVSSKDQNLERQLVEMKQLGVDKIFTDKESGKDFNRSEYKEMIEMIGEGDTLYVVSIDRLGRNYDEILEQWRIIVKEKKADIVVLDMPLLDTRSGRDLTGTLISDIVLQLLSYVAQKERENIRKRQAEGIAIAKAQGKYKGRKARAIDEDLFKRLYIEVKNGERTAVSAMSALGIGKTKWYEMCKRCGA